MNFWNNHSNNTIKVCSNTTDYPLGVVCTTDIPESNWWLVETTLFSSCIHEWMTFTDQWDTGATLVECLQCWRHPGVRLKKPNCSWPRKWSIFPTRSMKWESINSSKDQSHLGSPTAMEHDWTLVISYSKCLPNMSTTCSWLYALLQTTAGSF